MIYYEGPGASNGNAPPGNIRVTPLSASAAVQSIASHPSSTVYQIGHREGTAVANLQIARPGKFLVRVTSSAAPAGSDLAVGSNIAGGIAATVLPGLLLILSGVGGAIAIAIVRHSRAKRARLPVLLS